MDENLSINSSASGPEAAARNRLRETAGRMVGQIFFGTLLRQMRSSVLKGKYGHGGRGEEAFQAQLDQIIAERAGMGSRSSIADGIVGRFERAVTAQAQAGQGSMAGRTLPFPGMQTEAVSRVEEAYR